MLQLPQRATDKRGLKIKKLRWELHNLRNKRLRIRNKPGHVKKECSKYAAWRTKKGRLFTFVCSEVNLTSVWRNTWWVDSGATIHTFVSMQGCLWSRQPSDAVLFIYVGDGKAVPVEAIGTFRLSFDKKSHFIELRDTYVVPSFRRNFIYFLDSWIQLFLVN